MTTDTDARGAGEFAALKPCPLCGDSDVFVERDDYSSCFVQCNGCGMCGPVKMQESDDEETPGKAAAKAAWNRRAADPRAAPSKDAGTTEVAAFYPSVLEYIAALEARIREKDPRTAAGDDLAHLSGREQVNAAVAALKAKLDARGDARAAAAIVCRLSSDGACAREKCKAESERDEWRQRAERAEKERGEWKAKAIEEAKKALTAALVYTPRIEQLCIERDRAEARVAEIAKALGYCLDVMPGGPTYDPAYEQGKKALAEQPGRRGEADLTENKLGGEQAGRAGEGTLPCPYCNPERLDPGCSYCAGSGRWKPKT